MLLTLGYCSLSAVERGGVFVRELVLEGEGG